MDEHDYNDPGVTPCQKHGRAPCPYGCRPDTPYTTTAGEDPKCPRSCSHSWCSPEYGDYA
jgi:hypothetical protein